MLTLNTELQYKKSQYESLYSMRIKKFLHDSTCRRNQDKSDFVHRMPQHMPQHIDSNKETYSICRSTSAARAQAHGRRNRSGRIFMLTLYQLS